MSNILSNEGMGYDVSVQNNTTPAFFRMMGRMAVPEDEGIQIISPLCVAKEMKYNPSREAQIYTATLSLLSIDHAGAEVVFAIESTYLEVLGEIIICGTATGSVSSVSSEGVASVDMYPYMAELERSGALENGQTVVAHLMNMAEIDMYLDWGGIATTTPVPRDEFTEVAHRVKNGNSGDGLPLWKEMYPTGISVSYGVDGMSTCISLDTGIICSSPASTNAPDYIELECVSTMALPMNIRLYLNLPQMPVSLMPEYQLHPGQTNYGVSAYYANTGDISSQVMTIVEADVSGTYLPGIDVTVLLGHIPYSSSIVSSIYSAGVGTLVTLSNESIPDGAGATIRYSEYEYPDGEIFDPDHMETYQIPMMAKMFIARGRISLINLAVSETFQIIKISYMRDGMASMNETFMPYSISNYEVNIEDRTYTEIGDSEKDSIPAMRYVGHYGRNFIIGSTTDVTGVSPEISIPTPIRTKTELISGGSGFSSTGSTIAIDVESLVTNIPSVIPDNAVYNYYYMARYMCNSKAPISNLAIIKVYVPAAWGMRIGDIEAATSDNGYVLMLDRGEEMKILEDVKVGEEQISIEGETEILGEFVCKVKNEYIKCEKKSGTPDYVEIIERGCYGTIQVNHDAGDPVRIYDREFANARAGKVDTISGNIISLLEDIDPGMYPETGTLLIGNELLEYTAMEAGEITIDALSRGKYGSSICTIERGMDIHIISYFHISDIRPMQSLVCEYHDRYVPRITLPVNYEDDPVRFGAKSIYIMEIRYDTGKTV